MIRWDQRSTFNMGLHMNLLVKIWSFSFINFYHEARTGIQSAQLYFEYTVFCHKNMPLVVAVSWTLTFLTLYFHVTRCEVTALIGQTPLIIRVANDEWLAWSAGYPSLRRQSIWIQVNKRILLTRGTYRPIHVYWYTNMYYKWILATFCKNNF